MKRVSVREARESIGRLLDAVEAGEEVVITRRGRAVARMVPVEREAADRVRFVSRAELRSQLPPAKEPVERLIGELRKERL